MPDPFFSYVFREPVITIPALTGGLFGPKFKVGERVRLKNRTGWVGVVEQTPDSLGRYKLRRLNPAPCAYEYEYRYVGEIERAPFVVADCVGHDIEWRTYNGSQRIAKCVGSFVEDDTTWLVTATNQHPAGQSPSQRVVVKLDDVVQVVR